MDRPLAFVTGSTDGIGLRTARWLFDAGYRVILHGRSPQRLRDALAQFNLQGREQDVKTICCDLKSMRNIHTMCDTLIKEYLFDRLDLLINNAGVFEHKRLESDDGFEMTFAVNVIAPYIITARLLPVIRKTPGARVIEVGSISQPSHMDLSKIMHTENFDGYNAYDYSKLAVIAMTFEIAARYPDVWINTLDPGTVNSKMLIESWGRCGIELDDATDEFWLATTKGLDKTRGKYFVSKHETKAGKQAYDPAFRAQLLAILEKMTGVVLPA